MTSALSSLQDDAQLDDIIDRLLDVRTGRPGKQVTLTEQASPQPQGWTRDDLFWEFTWFRE